MRGQDVHSRPCLLIVFDTTWSNKQSLLTLLVYFHTILSFVFAFDEALLSCWAIDDYRSCYQAYQVRFESILAEDVEPQRRHLRRFGLSSARGWPAHLPQGILRSGGWGLPVIAGKSLLWMATKQETGGRMKIVGSYEIWIILIYPPVIWHSYGKSPFIVDIPMKNCDFP